MFSLVLFALFLGRFRRGLASANSSLILTLPRQFPRMLLHSLLMTRRARVLHRNSVLDGFSCALPLCLFCPKNFSRGS